MDAMAKNTIAKGVVEMDKLVKFVSEKTGMSEEMSQKAADAVLEYLKENMPDPVVSVMEKVLGGGEIGLDEAAKELKDAFKFP